MEQDSGDSLLPGPQSAKWWSGWGTRTRRGGWRHQRPCRVLSDHQSQTTSPQPGAPPPARARGGAAEGRPLLRPLGLLPSCILGRRPGPAVLTTALQTCPSNAQMDRKHGRDQTCCHVEFSENRQSDGHAGRPHPAQPGGGPPCPSPCLAPFPRPPTAGGGAWVVVRSGGVNRRSKGQGSLR